MKGGYQTCLQKENYFCHLELPSRTENTDSVWLTSSTVYITPTKLPHWWCAASPGFDNHPQFPERCLRWICKLIIITAAEKLWCLMHSPCFSALPMIWTWISMFSSMVWSIISIFIQAFPGSKFCAFNSLVSLLTVLSGFLTRNLHSSFSTEER